MNNEDNEDYLYLNDSKIKTIFTLGVRMIICLEEVTLAFSLKVPNYRYWKEFFKKVIFNIQLNA